MSRLCRKCGKTIPAQVKIEGKTYKLYTRKFCLDCSAFRGHNTSPFDPLIRQEKKYCKLTEEQKERIKMSLYKRALERKVKIIAMAGGKCSICGYNNNRRALTFHHEDRSTKLFGLTLNNLWSKSWEDIEREANKCKLLCMNCHAEVEDQLTGDMGS